MVSQTSNGSILKLRIDPKKLLADEFALDQILPALEETVRRQKHPYYAYKPDRSPDRNQVAFHKSEKMLVLGSGGNQSGKSRMAAQEICWWLAEEHPFKKTPKAPKIWCVSALYQNLWEGVYGHFKECFPSWEIASNGPCVDGWEIPKWTRAKNGGQVWWFSAEGGGTRSRKKFQSAAIDLALVDEEVEEEVKTEILMRLLAKEGRIYVTATMVESEPWIVEIENRAESGDPDVDLVRLNTRAAARAGHISGKALRMIEKNLSEEEREVRIEGRSRKTQGLVYPEFEPQLHVVAPQKIDGPCTKYCAIDPGWNVCAVLWCAVFPDGSTCLYRELYMTNKNSRQVAYEILKAEGWKWNPVDKVMLPTPESETIECRVIDPSAYGVNTDGSPRIAHRLPKFGVQMLRKAQTDIDVGIDIVRDTMREIDADGKPKFSVQRHLTNWLRERASYRFPRRRPKGDRADPKMKPIKKADHLMDCTRYLYNLAGGLRHRPQPSESALAALRFERTKYHTGAVGTLDMALKADAKRIKEDHHNERHYGYVKGPPGGMGSEW